MPPTGDAVLELPDECTLELVWKNNERLKEYVLVRSKELEFDEDPGSATETARAGHFTLEQCLNLFTKPEVLAPEEAWYGHTLSLVNAKLLHIAFLKLHITNISVMQVLS